MFSVEIHTWMALRCVTLERNEQHSQAKHENDDQVNVR